MQAALRKPNVRPERSLVFDFAARRHKGGRGHGTVRSECLWRGGVFLWLLGHFVAALFTFGHGVSLGCIPTWEGLMLKHKAAESAALWGLEVGAIQAGWVIT
jgi:hypothetical protein